MYIKWDKGFLDTSSYKGEKGWLKSAPDPWTHCTSLTIQSNYLLAFKKSNFEEIPSPFGCFDTPVISEQK